MSSDFSNDHIEIKLNNKQSLYIHAVKKTKFKTLFQLPTENALENGEEEVQLLEGCAYEYELPENFEFKPISKIITPSSKKNCKNEGRITPGIYVGRISFEIINDKGESEFIGLEVRSIKTNYRTEYRQMLKYITKESVDLLMLHSSPVTQKYSINYNKNSETLYQKFAFVKSTINSDEFKNAVNRIISMPVTSWSYRTEEMDVRRIRRIGSKHIRQFASKTNRINLPEHHPLRATIKSVPSSLTTEIKVDTVDTPENRFIKYVLKEFMQFCSSICQHIEKKKNKSDRIPQIFYEAQALEGKFSEYLSHNIFREIQSPHSLPLNSPILQRKSGYRKILSTWLMYDLAAKLVWNGLDKDSYQIGKRDVATMYEYWLFFQLLSKIEKIFKIDDNELKKLTVETKDGLGLQLLSGKHTLIKGKYNTAGRNLRMQFNYNRTFSSSKYPMGGSWTRQMRPDYTLSLWPDDFTDDEAEKLELMVHIHFDAKYKVEGLEYLANDAEEEMSEDEKSRFLSEEKSLQKKGTYKRADLLKMHAYKDAIRRTVGAYVLYPGTTPYNIKGFHEITPGLGAFPISPSNSDSNMKDIGSFIEEVVKHVSNRASNQERISFHQYSIQSNDSENIIDNIPEFENKQKSKKVNKTVENKISESIPDYNVNIKANKKVRTLHPSDINVLVAFHKGKKHLDWVNQNSVYNIRYGSQYSLTPEMIGSHYILLYTNNENTSNKFYKIKKEGPKFYSNKELISILNYPFTPSKEVYLVYTLEKGIPKEFENYEWDLANIKSNDYKPKVVTLTKLMVAKSK